MRTVRTRPRAGQEIDPRSSHPDRSPGHKPPERNPRREHPSTLPAVALVDSAITEQMPFIRHVLRRRGVLPADLEDVTQETVLGAWRSMKAGRFRPAPTDHPGDAVRSWVAGIACRQMADSRNKAYRRYEIALVDLRALARVPTPSPHQRLAARSLLRNFGRLRPELQEVLGRAALGMRLQEIASDLAIPIGTVFSRLYLARRRFAEALKRWRK